jgi:cytochrome c peroxidase
MRGCIIGATVLLAFTGCSGTDSDEEVGEETADVLSASSSRRCGFEAAGATFHTSGAIDRTNPFFLGDLGANGRSCESCHDARAGFTQSRTLAKQLFRETDGNHPLFRPHDGANSPNADVSTVEARRAAYSMMLKHNTTRFNRTVPAAGFAEFTVEAVSDPYGFSTTTTWSNFRKATSTSMETKEVTITWTGAPADLMPRLQLLVNAAAKGHALRPTDVPLDQQIAGAEFMAGTFFAQAVDAHAGPLDADGATGGPEHFARAPFYVGQNALGGDTVTGAPFDPVVFTLFEAWRDADNPRRNRHRDRCDRERDHARAQIARGEDLFNTLRFDIRGVNGLNDALGQETVRGTCTTCHNSPNIGGHSEFRLMDTGVAVASVASGDYPVVTVRNKTTGEVRKTTDLGRGTTGLWADLGKFKAPPLRGLNARAPYFHDGSAASLKDVVRFYKERFRIRLDRNDEEDLIAFLQAL